LSILIFCLTCERKVYIAVAKFEHSIVGVICTGCDKTIPVTPEFLAAIREQ
jgi:hypothetical protein